MLTAVRRCRLLEFEFDVRAARTNGAEERAAIVFDFCDMSFVMPFMKWLGANGPIDPMRAVEIVNEVSLQFFDAYLRDGPKPRFDNQKLPELRVTMNAEANR